MKVLAGVNRRDRRLLLLSLGLITAMIVLLGIFAPAKSDDDPVPTSWGTGNHGAKAAYLALGQSGYKIERWTDPLVQLASQADAHTFLVLAEPYPFNVEEQRTAIVTLLNHGAHILATGMAGAMLLPHNEAVSSSADFVQECRATPVGMDNSARAEDVRMDRRSFWSKTAVEDRTQYLCGKDAVVVTYPYGKGDVTWWGDASPLENRGISKGTNLEFLLRTIGPPDQTKIFWDESLHGAAPSLWSYAEGTPVQLGVLQITFAAALLLLSFGRRSGPIRPDPKTTRASAGEFVRSLGGLFQKAHATQAAVAIACQHLRRQLHLHLGVPATSSAHQAAEIASRRAADPQGTLANDLRFAEKVIAGEPVSEAKALLLVQALDDHEQKLRLLWKGR